MNEFYELLNLEQGTDSWKQERLKYVTASQVPILFNISPYDTISDLFEEKISGAEKEVNAFKQKLFQQGHDAELAGREWIEAEMGIKFPPLVIVSKNCPGLLASLDGFNAQTNVGFEAKFMGAKALEDVKKGKIKPNHEIQVQSQLLASGAQKFLYFATTPSGDSAVLEIKPRQDYAQKINYAVAEFQKDIGILRDALQKCEVLKIGMIQKHKNLMAEPLKVLPSGAKDPFRVRTR